MALQKKTAVKKVAEKNIGKEILDKILEVLETYKKDLGDKKFEKKVNKISKLFSKDLLKVKKDISKVPVKKNKVVKKKALLK